MAKIGLGHGFKSVIMKETKYISNMVLFFRILTIFFLAAVLYGVVTIISQKIVITYYTITNLNNALNFSICNCGK